MKRRDQDFRREYIPFLDNMMMKSTPYEFLFNSSNNLEFEEISKLNLFDNANEELGIENWISECKPESALNNKDVKRNELGNCFLNNFLKDEPEFCFHPTSKLSWELRDFQAYSQEHELSLDFNIRTSPRWASAKPPNYDSFIEPKEFPASNCHNKQTFMDCADPIEETKNKENNECENAGWKITELWNILKDIKGVNTEMLDQEIINKTFALGQKLVAQQLNIPYRRFKLILNKVGIKTNAGRKVKWPILEWELIEWIKQIKFRDRHLLRNLIKRKAQEIKKKLMSQGNQSVKKFKFSKGWLDKFLKRYESNNH